MDKLYHLASQYWTHEARSVLHQLNSGFDLRRFELRNMLGRVPPLPDRLTYGLTRSCSSNWHVTGSANCESSGRPIQVPPVQLNWDIIAPTKVTLNGGSFHAWFEFEGGQSNLLAILVLAWSYILSARLTELQGQDGCGIAYTESRAPLCRAHESASGFLLDVGVVAARELRWFTAVLAPGSGFKYTLPQQIGFSPHSPWKLSVVAPSIPFSICCGESCEDFDPHGQTPLTSYEALQSVVALCNSHGVSLCQLHAALATAILLPTHNYLQVDAALPYPEIHKTGHTAMTIRPDDLDRLFGDLPCYITLSCAVEVIMSSLCGIFWNPDVSCNLVSPWLQPVWDLRVMKEVQSVSGRYAEVVALICAGRAPSLAFLSIATSISGLTFKILDQVSSGQPPLDKHAYAWTGVPQSFMDVEGEGGYYKMRSSKAYIRRSDCWRLRRIPPTTDDGLYYRIGPFTPWKPPGWGLLRNCPLRTQVHMDCDRHAIAYQGVSWDFHNESILENDMGRNSVIPHASPDFLNEDEASDNLRHLENQTTSIDATISAFRWVLDNGEGRPAESAYEDPWLSPIYKTDSEDEEISNDSSSYTGEAQRKFDSWL